MTGNCEASEPHSWHGNPGQSLKPAIPNPVDPEADGSESLDLRPCPAPSPGKSQGKPQFFGSDPSGGGSAAAYGPELPEEVEESPDCGTGICH